MAEMLHDPLRLDLSKQRAQLAAETELDVPDPINPSDFLAYLTRLLILPAYTTTVVSLFRPILFDLCARFLISDDDSEDKLAVLCLLIESYQELYPILHELLLRPDFKNGLLDTVSSQPTTQSRLHKLLLAYYRILQANGQLPTLLHWSPYPLSHIIHDSRYDNGSRLLAIHCYALQIGIVEQDRAKIEQEVFGELYGPDCSIEYSTQLDGSLIVTDGWILPWTEDRRIADHLKCLPATKPYPFLQTPILTSSDLSPFTTNIHGILMFRTPGSSSQTPLIITPTTTKALQRISIYLACDLPILLASPPSSGKSLLISHLATTLRPTSTTQVITIHLADTSLDPRSLIGSYVSSATQPGSFEWKEGVLVRAMKEGKWVIFKDIDRASAEVLGVLKPLVESLHSGKWIGGRAELDVPNKGKVVAAYGFQIFATRSTLPYQSGSLPAATFFGAHKFFEVGFEAPTSDDLRLIIDTKFPPLAGVVAAGIIGLWEAAKSVASPVSAARDISIRDLEKLCSRASRLLPPSSSSMDVDLDSSPTSLISTIPNVSVREAIFIEARDIFFGAGASTSAGKSHLDALGSVIAQQLGIDDERREFLLHQRVPEFRVEKDTNGRNTAVVAGQTRLLASPRLSMAPISTPSRPFAMHRPATVLMSRLASAISQREPILLTGETGTGKTSIVTHLSSLLNRNLISLNLSQQTESSDLLGGFKPVNARGPASTLQETFIELFGGTFSRRKNEKFEGEVRKAVGEAKWKRAVALWKESIRLAKERIRSREEGERTEGQETPRKKRKIDHGGEKITEVMWTRFEERVNEFEVQHVHGKSKFAFDFIEGPLVKAIRHGDWVLLDEINLASSETLECISSLLQGPTASITLTEQGSLEPVPRHPEFRLFGCMNPATDVGKKDLPPNIRSRFTEIDVPSPDSDRETLLSIVQQYIGGHAVGDRAALLDVTEFYAAVNKLSMDHKLADGSNRRPHYSMRTLTRALTFTADTANMFGLRRALWEGCLMAFTMVLEGESAVKVTELAKKHLLSGVKNPNSILARVPSAPPSVSPDDFISIPPFYLEKGPLSLDPVVDYVLTPSVRTKLTDLARIILTRRFPVLIEGPTSAGKTSSIEYLARRTGHRFIRINNHEHTDIQEYIGSYVSDASTGKLVFRDGLLVQALRNGDWIVLDELNLAPTDVLEALNRLLDDNRELVIPETHEVVRPHKNFMLFATQNPPGVYAGRKVLSRAFRNRFLEVHFDDVPQDELKDILHQRCRIAPSYAEKIVRVFLELQKRRQSGRVFESKHGFATLRDLFRWAGRDAIGYQQLAENGYMLLAERTRRNNDKVVVQEIIESVMKVRLDVNKLYDFQSLPLDHVDFLGCSIPYPPNFIWTKAMQRLFVLVARALRYNEPVLLVGETGAGKTSVCQVFADACGKVLSSVNCHQNTETADLIGGLRPIRNRGALAASTLVDAVPLFQQLGRPIPETIADLALTIKQLVKELDLTTDHREQLDALSRRLVQSQSIFEWQDGPLIQTMKGGSIFLLDEISLADDSVLERLNPVLEPSRTIVLAERGGDNRESPVVVADESFKLISTMNPGGDYGKKELSPALRNRFTEIWVPAVDDREDLDLIVRHSWKYEDLKVFTPLILDFVEWLCKSIGDRSIAGLRDILAWVNFSNFAHQPLEPDCLTPSHIFHHAAKMTFLDGLSSLPQLSSWSPGQIRRIIDEATSYLHTVVPVDNDDNFGPIYDPTKFVQLGTFAVPLGPNSPSPLAFNLQAPTTLHNVTRVVRALQVPKPILLEGSPGVGKTSLVTALASISGYELCRINLSDQTDLIDLFGSDLPVEGGRPGEFAWKDGEFLVALQQGRWVLLDEMNLAPQAILEGLNAVLDHRGTVYIPELGRSFKKHPNFRVFAAQNPLNQGGGRKGLPKSFINRFTRVYVDELTPDDLLAICRHLLPSIPSEQLRQMIRFNTDLNHTVTTRRSFGSSGAPWEFNLRDVIRWGQLFTQTPGLHPGDFLRTVYLGRFRTPADQNFARSLFENAFQIESSFMDKQPRVDIASDFSILGHRSLARSRDKNGDRPRLLLKQHHRALEALADCVHHGWLAIVTGPRETGKTSLIQVFARLKGVTLHQVHLNSATDTMDLLGGFEQVDVHQSLRSSLALLVADLMRRLRFAYPQWAPEQYEALQRLATVDASQFNAETLLPLLSILPDLPATQNVFAALQLAKEGSSGKFEWIDGPLTTAIKAGHWLVLESANLCNASVLDRLNSLCEPNGSLTLSERGYVDGAIPILHPHPDFRLFMTVDPHFGELSRAMRNRGIEIFIGDASHQLDGSLLCRYHRVSKLQDILSISLSLDSSLRRGINEATSSESLHSSFLAENTVLQRALEPLLRLPGADPSCTSYVSSRVQSFDSIPIYRRARTVYPSLLDQLFYPESTVRALYESLRLTEANIRFLWSQSIDPALGNAPRSLGHFQPPHSQLHHLIFHLLRLRTSAHLIVKTSLQVKRQLPQKSSNKTSLRLAEVISALYDAIPLLAEEISASATSSKHWQVFGRIIQVCLQLQHTIRPEALDFSSLRVLINWLVEEGIDQVSELKTVAQHIQTLQQILALKTGLGLFEIWHLFSRIPVSLAVDVKALPELTTPRPSILRARTLDLLAFRQLKSQSCDTAISISLPATIQITPLPTTSITLRQSIFNSIRTIFSLSTNRSRLSAILPRLLHISCEMSSLPLSWLASLRGLDWALSADEDYTPYVARAIIDWLSDIWFGNEPEGPGFLLQATQLTTCVRLCYSPSLSLNSLSSFEEEISFQAQTEAMSCDDNLSGSEKLTEILTFSLTLFLSAFDPTFRPTSPTGGPTCIRLRNIVSAIKDSKHPAFVGKGWGHLQEAVRSISTEMSYQDGVPLAQSYIAFATFALDLFIPDPPVDPAACEKFTAETLQRFASDLQNQLGLHKDLEMASSGNQDNETIDLLRNELDIISSQRKQYVTSHKPRDPLTLQSFWAEVSQFQRQALSSSRIESLVSLLLGRTMGSSQQEVVVQESIHGFLQRLTEAYPYFDDLLFPLRFALLHLRLGLRLLASISQTPPNDRAERIARAAVTYPSLRGVVLSSAVDGPPSGCSPFNLLLFQLSAAATALSCGQNISGFSVPSSYEQVFRLWSLENARKEQGDLEAQSLYRRSVVSHQAMTDAEVEEEELKALFPLFEDVLDDNAVSAPTKKIPSSIQRRQITQLISIHYSLVLPSKDPQVSISPYEQSKEGLLQEIVGQDDTPTLRLSEARDCESKAYRLAAYCRVQKNSSSEVPSSISNFYTDPNRLETRKAEKVVSNLKNRLVELTEDWPDQMVLPHLILWCDSILSLSLSSPIAKVLTSLELLLSKTDDWENYANRENTLKAYRQALTDLIVEWRRLELSSWKVLLDTQAKDCQDEVGSWWFRLYELLIRGCHDASEGASEDAFAAYLDNLVPLLRDYMRSSPVGQFESRLRLLESFRSYYLSFVPSHWATRVATLLFTLTTEFRTFLPAVHASLLAARKPLEQEISNFIKLASWKDVNIHALKQSAQRTHHKLYKIIRKFREALREPSSPHLHFHSTTLSNVLDPPITSQPMLTVSGEVGPLPPALQGENIPSHLQHLDQTVRKYYSIVGSSIVPFLEPLSGENADDLAGEILSTTQSLSQTALPADKDKRKKAAKALLVRKRKAWSDLLKELKRAGVPSSLTPISLKHQQNPRWILEHLRLIEGNLYDDGEGYLLKCLTLLPNARASLAHHHDDLNTRELQRGVTFMEGIFALILRARNRLAVLVPVVRDLRRIRSRWQDWIARPGLSWTAENLASQLQALLAVCRGTEFSLQEALDGLVALADTSKDRSVLESVKPMLEKGQVETRMGLMDLEEVAKRVSIMPVAVLFEDEKTVVHATIQHLREVVATLQHHSNMIPQTRYLLSPVAQWIEDQLPSSTVVFETNHDIHFQEDTLLNLYLVSVQHILALIPLSSEDTREAYISSNLQSILDTSSALNADGIRTELMQAFSSLVLSTELSLENKVNALKRLEPFASTHLSLVERNVSALASLIRALSKLGYIFSSLLLSLAKQGFCQPADEEKEDGNADGSVEMTDGTGLGAGSGAKNVSNEIEDESQVEGLKGQDDEEHEDKESREEGDENAIEMGDDMEGDLEDVPDNEEDNEQDGDEGDEDDNDEPEERREDLDATDPNAIDEKLWGDDAGEESSSHDDKTNQDRSKQDAGESEVVAKEGESKTGKDQEEQDPDQQKEDGDEIAEDLPDETQPNEAGGKLEEHVPDASALDLPDDLNLGENDDAGNETANDDDDDDGLSLNDAEGSDAGMQEDEHPTPGPDNDIKQDDEDNDMRAVGEDEQNPSDEPPEDSAIAQPDVASGQGDNTSVQQQAGQQGVGARIDQSTDSGVDASQDTAQDTKDTSPGGEHETPKNLADSAPDNGADGTIGAGEAIGRDDQSAMQNQADHSQDAPSPNPFQRSLVDTAKEIQQRFDDILYGREDTQREIPADTPQQSAQLEYLQPHEQDHDMEALAPADTDPYAKLNDLHIAEIDGDDSTTPMEVDLPKSIAEDLQSINPVSRELEAPKVELRDTLDSVVRGDRNSTSGISQTQDDLEIDSQKLEVQLRKWQASEYADKEFSEKLWTIYSALTQDLAYSLCEQLRLILEPTLATRLKGDYRTGKRLNMKKVISYIASDYTKDKIWLRRTRPSQREYQILIALDDSRSMAESHSIHLAYQTLTLVTKALDKLEAGEIAIVKFGESVDVLHAFEDGALSAQAGSRVLDAFRFDQKATNVLSLVEASLKVLEDAKERRTSSSGAELWQLQVIISDGMCQDHEKLQSVLRKAEEQKVLIVFIVIDSLHQASSEVENSILTMEKAEFKNVDGRMELQLKRYLDSFPFEYYVVLQSMEKLPEVLAGTLKQFFERISEE